MAMELANDKLEFIEAYKHQTGFEIVSLILNNLKSKVRKFFPSMDVDTPDLPLYQVLDSTASREEKIEQISKLGWNKEHSGNMVDSHEMKYTDTRRLGLYARREYCFFILFENNTTEYFYFIGIITKYINEFLSNFNAQYKMHHYEDAGDASGRYQSSIRFDIKYHFDVV